MTVQSIYKRLRTKKEDSAFVYAILESYEGVSAYSTLPHETGADFRDILLQIPPDFEKTVDRIVTLLGEICYEFEPTDQRFS